MLAFVPQDLVANAAQYGRSGGLAQRGVVDLGDYLRRDQHGSRNFEAAKLAQAPKNRIGPSPGTSRDAGQVHKAAKVAGVSLLLTNEERDGFGVGRGAPVGGELAGATQDVLSFRALTQLKLTDGPTDCGAFQVTDFCAAPPGNLKKRLAVVAVIVEPGYGQASFGRLVRRGCR